MARQDDTPSMALFCDFENVALGVRDAKYDKFDIRKVLERLLLKGSIVVKKAYCDWNRYREFKAEMHEASFELIEIPHVRQSGKNSADIRMVVDALDLCYTKSHVDTFVIISGDSDFSPLVSKLRENAKTVIGVGVKGSTSDLLTANCDEFIFYDDLVREQRRRGAARGGRGEARADTREGGRDGAREATREGSRDAVREGTAREGTAREGTAREGGPRNGRAARTETASAPALPAAATAASSIEAVAPAPVEAPVTVADAADAGPAAGAADAAATDAQAAPKKRAPRRRRTAAAGATADGAPAEAAPIEPTGSPEDTAPAAGLGATDAAEGDGALTVDAEPDDPFLTSLLPESALDERPAEGRREKRSEEERRQEAVDLVVETVEALLAERGADDKIWGSMVKQTLKRRRPGFAESYYGYRSFNDLLEDARGRGLLALDHDEKSGGYVIRLL